MMFHAAGAVGASRFATVKSVYEQCAPATIDYRDADPGYDLWVVRETGPHDALCAVEQHRARRAGAVSSSVTTETDTP
jgi:hypothetical protein